VDQIDEYGFLYKNQEQQSNKQNHGAETLSFVAWEPSSGRLGRRQYLIGKTADAVTHEFYNISFIDPFGSSPAFLAAMQTTNSLDISNVRYASKDNFAVDVLIHEEQSWDAEVRHGHEVVGYMAFDITPDSDDVGLSD
jgi:hypothetical protein